MAQEGYLLAPFGNRNLQFWYCLAPVHAEEKILPHDVLQPLAHKDVHHSLTL